MTLAERIVFELLSDLAGHKHVAGRPDVSYRELNSAWTAIVESEIRKATGVR